MKSLLVVLAVPALWFAFVVFRGFRKAARRRPAAEFTSDHSTPEGAIRVYQAAVERHDIDAMVAAKDFLDEAEKLVRAQIGGPPDTTLFEQTAGTLEQAFRAQWQAAAWPDLQNTRSYFSEPLPLSDHVVFINHEVVYPTGAREVARLRLVRRGAYWRVSHAPS
jgi:hypothetical protein